MWEATLKPISSYVFEICIKKFQLICIYHVAAKGSQKQHRLTELRYRVYYREYEQLGREIRTEFHRPLRTAIVPKITSNPKQPWSASSSLVTDRTPHNIIVDLTLIRSFDWDSPTKVYGRQQVHNKNHVREHLLLRYLSKISTRIFNTPPQLPEPSVLGFSFIVVTDFKRQIDRQIVRPQTCLFGYPLIDVRIKRFNLFIKIHSGEYSPCVMHMEISIE